MSKASLYLNRLAVALAVVSLGYIAWIHLSVLLISHPQTYRECVITLTTDFLAHGGNPYSLAEQPARTNVYGVAYNLVVLAFWKFFGGGLIVHRVVAGFFVLGCCAMIFGALRFLRMSAGIAFIGAVLLYADLAARWTDLRPFGMPLSITARPDAMGLMLFLGSILIPWRWEFSRKSLSIAGCLAVLGFFTKPYFVIGLPIIAAYLFLFRSKARGLVYGLTFGLLLILVLGIVCLRCDCYYANIITSNASAAGQRVPRHLLAQSRAYALALPGCLSILAISAAIRLSQWRPADRPASDKSLISIKNTHAPLFGRSIDLFVFTLLCCSILFIKLGMHGGNSMLYMYQFISPWLILVVLPIVGRQRFRAGAVFTALLSLDLLLFLLSRPIIPTAHADVWDQWRSILSSYPNVYAPPPLAQILNEQGKTVYDNGSSEYFIFSSIGSIYPPSQVLKKQYDDYILRIGQQVIEERFDLIVLPYDEDKPLFCFIPTDLLTQHYKPIGMMDIPMDWEPVYHGVLFVRLKSTARP